MALVPQPSKAWLCTLLPRGCVCARPLTPEEAKAAREAPGGGGRAVCGQRQPVLGRPPGEGPSETSPGCGVVGLLLALTSGEGVTRRGDRSPDRCQWALSFVSNGQQGICLGYDDAVSILQVKEGKIFDDVSSGFSELAAKVGKPRLTGGLG